jgi:hypothetical protein
MSVKTFDYAMYVTKRREPSRARFAVQDYAKMPRNPGLSVKSPRASIWKPLALIVTNLGLIALTGYLLQKFI